VTIERSEALKFADFEVGHHSDGGFVLHVRPRDPNTPLSEPVRSAIESEIRTLTGKADYVWQPHYAEDWLDRAVHHTGNQPWQSVVFSHEHETKTAGWLERQVQALFASEPKVTAASYDTALARINGFQRDMRAMGLLENLNIYGSVNTALRGRYNGHYTPHPVDAAAKPSITAESHLPSHSGHWLIVPEPLGAGERIDAALIKAAEEHIHDPEAIFPRTANFRVPGAEIIHQHEHLRDGLLDRVRYRAIEFKTPEAAARVQALLAEPVGMFSPRIRATLHSITEPHIAIDELIAGHHASLKGLPAPVKPAAPVAEEALPKEQAALLKAEGETLLAAAHPPAAAPVVENPLGHTKLRIQQQPGGKIELKITLRDPAAPHANSLLQQAGKAASEHGLPLPKKVGNSYIYVMTSEQAHAIPDLPGLIARFEPECVDISEAARASLRLAKPIKHAAVAAVKAPLEAAPPLEPNPPAETTPLADPAHSTTENAGALHAPTPPIKEEPPLTKVTADTAELHPAPHSYSPTPSSTVKAAEQTFLEAHGNKLAIAAAAATTGWALLEMQRRSETPHRHPEYTP